jgi:septal ring factor EnvC (AmiA/AmiB activator)
VDTAAAAAKGLTRQNSRPDKPSAFSRAINAARVVLPVVQKVLPLLEGNVASAAANLLAPTPRPVDLEPVKTAIGKLQAEQRALRGHVTDQKRSLESVEYELAAIKEGLDRNSAELRELAEDQLKLRRRLSRLAWTMFILLFLSLTLTGLICVRLAYILRP